MPNRIHPLVAALVLLCLVLAGAACAPARPPLASAVPVAPIHLAAGLAQVDVCKAVPQEDIEAVMGRKLSAMPGPFEYYDTPGSSGCWYDAGKDSTGSAHFAYVAFTPLSAYKGEPLYMNKDVSGIGQEAYYNNGPDARQLWVKVTDDAALVVAFGGSPNEEGDRQIAELILAAIK
jgi:hypothetical protein